MKTLQFEIDIAAPVAKVWEIMFDDESYQQWTTAFTEGSYYEGSWEEGESIRFMSPSGNGMVSIIARNRPQELVSIKHLGYVVNGVVDTGSEEVQAWAPAYENYYFRKIDRGTRLRIEQEITEDFAQYMCEAWPKALTSLRNLCEED